MNDTSRPLMSDPLKTGDESEITFYPYGNGDEDVSIKIGSFTDANGELWYGYYIQVSKDHSKYVEIMRSKFLQTLYKFQFFIDVHNLMPETIQQMTSSVVHKRIINGIFGSPELRTKEVMKINEGWLKENILGIDKDADIEEGKRVFDEGQKKAQEGASNSA